MNLWRVLLSNKKEALFVFLLIILLPTFTACSLSNSTPRAVTSTATTLSSETPTVTGSVTPSVTPSITPSITPSVTPKPTSTLEFTTTLEATSTTEAKQFPFCKMEEYKNCRIQPEDLLDYAEWTKQRLLEQGFTMPEPDPEHVSITHLGGDDIGFIYLFDSSKYKYPSSPYCVGDSWAVMNAVVVVDTPPVRRTATYAVSTIIFPVPGKPGEFVVNPIISEIGVGLTDDMEIKILNNFYKKSSILIFVKDHRYSTIPVDDMNNSKFPDLSNLMQDFYSTLDPTHIDGVIFEAFPESG